MPDLYAGVTKETRALLQWASKCGCDVRRTNGGHVRVTTLAGATVHLAATGKHYGRGHKNMRRQLERAIGHRYPHGGKLCRTAT